MTKFSILALIFSAGCSCSDYLLNDFANLDEYYDDTGNKINDLPGWNNGEIIVDIDTGDVTDSGPDTGCQDTGIAVDTGSAVDTGEIDELAYTPITGNYLVWEATYGHGEIHFATDYGYETFATGGDGGWKPQIICGIASSGIPSCTIDYTYNSSPYQWTRDVATDVPFRTDFIDIKVGKDHACGLTSTGGIDCWGYDTPSYGSDWDGNDSPSSGYFVDMSVGPYHVCGLLDTGYVYCWGNTSVRSAPPTDQFIDIFGSSLSCGITTNYHLKCWGNAVAPQYDYDLLAVLESELGTGDISILQADANEWGIAVLYQHNGKTGIYSDSPGGFYDGAQCIGSYPSSDSSYFYPNEFESIRAGYYGNGVGALLDSGDSLLYGGGTAGSTDFTWNTTHSASSCAYGWTL